MYEALVIFPDSVNEESLDGAVKKVGEEISKSGGEVLGSESLGRRTFARPLGKETAGHYVVVDFKLEGKYIDELRTRLKMGGVVHRVQFMNKPATPPRAKAETEEA